MNFTLIECQICKGDGWFHRPDKEGLMCLRCKGSGKAKLYEHGSPEQILQSAMSEPYCGYTRFDFLDSTELPLIVEAMNVYLKYKATSYKQPLNETVEGHQAAIIERQDSHIKALKNLLRSASCPICDGSGIIPTDPNEPFDITKSTCNWCTDTNVFLRLSV